MTLWVLLGLPGLCVLARFDRASFERGPLSVLGRSYVASFALLTPVSVLGYLTEAPLALLSAAFVALVLTSLVLLVRDRSWLRPWSLPGPAAIACLAWLAFDVWLAVRVGSHTSGDAGYHVARARRILALGFNNQDPLLPGAALEQVYWSNLYHAWIAVTAQLGRVDPGVAWVWVWPALKLVVAAGYFELASAVFGRRFCGYLAAIAAGVFFATSSTLVFPNSLSQFAIFPFALACAVEALAAAPKLRHALWLGAASLLLAQTHPLYALFFGLAAGPVLGLRLAVAVALRRPGRLRLLASVAALGLALPWLVPQAQDRLEPFWQARGPVTFRLLSVASAQAPAAWKPKPAKRSARERAQERFVAVPPDRLRLDASPFLSLRQPLSHGIAAALLVLAIGPGRRREALAMAGVLAAALALVFVPAVCTLLVDLLGNWVVVRFTKLFPVVSLALAPAAVAFALVRALRAIPAARGGGPLERGARAAIELGGVLAALAYGEHFGSYGAPWTQEATWQGARQFVARARAERIARRASFFDANVPAGASVFAPLFLDYDLPMHCLCQAFVFRRGRGERGQAGLDARRAAVERFYARGTPGHERQALLREHGVRYVFSSSGRAPGLARSLGDLARGTVSRGADAIIFVAP